MLLLQQMIVLFLLMAVGFFCYKKKIITDEVSRKLSMIVVNIANPALILTGGMGESRIQGKELLMIGVLVCIFYGALILLATAVPPLLRIGKGSRGTYRAMMVFSNIGFMGYPVISALYGREAILYASIFSIPYNILIYTYGVNQLSMEEKRGTFKESFSLKQILNVGVIACFITLAIYIFQIPVPQFIVSTVTHLSNLTAPLSMMVIGASLAVMNLKELFTDGKLLIFSFLKLLVVPVLGMLIISQVIENEMLRGVCMVMLATPVGSMTAMLAQQGGGDYERASKGVALTTVLSVATMPIVFALTM